MVTAIWRAPNAVSTCSDQTLAFYDPGTIQAYKAIKKMTHFNFYEQPQHKEYAE